MKHQTPGYFERDVVDFQQFFKKAYANTEILSQNAATHGIARSIIKTANFKDKKQPVQRAC